MKNREKWAKESYSKFWTAQVVKYGFDEYCTGLYNLIKAKNPQKIYELAIGTGWPFAINLYKEGIDVYGSDISDHLIDQIHLNCPEINAVAVSYEDIPGTLSNEFDVVYCFRSTWYFPDIYKAIDTMFDLTKKNGWVIFDIMNIDSAYIKNIIFRHRALIPYTIGKNLVKMLMNVFFEKKYLTQHLWNVHELPVSEKGIESYLIKKGITYQKFSINQVSDNFQSQFSVRRFDNSKIVFECRK